MSSQPVEAVSSPPLLTATVAQYASIVARAAPDLRSAQSTMISCLAVNGTEGYLPASVAVLGGHALVGMLVAAVTPGDSGYIGPPPAEIVKLVQQTAADASTLSADITEMTVCLKAKTCQGNKTLTVVLVHLSALVNDFDAWQPYM